MSKSNAARSQVSPGNEAHLHAFATERIMAPMMPEPRFICTPRPNLPARNLLAAGEKRIFNLGPAYRNRERGDLHAPEFTMLEWYRAGEPYDAVISPIATRS